MFVPKYQEQGVTVASSRIATPLFSINTAHKCIRFYYYMKGNNVGALNAYILQENMTLPLTPSWTVNGSKGNLWEYGFVDIVPQPANYRVGAAVQS